MSLSWCPQDNDLLLSCGKDNRSICWNPQTGASYGEFSVVTNWTFQTRWNPRNPNILATASFDGKIEVQTIQTTRSEADLSSERHIKLSDDKDFFNLPQVHQSDSSFILPHAPKWMKTPCGASFGFGGKIISFKLAPKTGSLNHSDVRISHFAIDIEASAQTEAFEKALHLESLTNICKTRIEEATNNSEKSDWHTIKALTLENPRKQIIDYLGFPPTSEPTKEAIESIGSEESAPTSKAGPEGAQKTRLSAFFDDHPDSGSFLPGLESSQGTKTNNPFQIYSGSETETQHQLTQALLLGQFDKALDVSLREGNLSDAFMIAICGGENCITKVQKAYFNQKSEGPNYLRLLASIVNKNLWDIVYNADLSDWKEVMTVLCTYAGAEEFSDLCEALGDRLESELNASGATPNVRNDASFCYLAGSRLERVVTIWISDLEKYSDPASQISSSSQSTSSLYSRSLQAFIERVTVFREVIHFRDGDLLASSGWKLATLYKKYLEYADMVASYGQLHIAERYLALVPEKYPAAEISRNRVKEAITRPVTHEAQGSRLLAQKEPSHVTSINGQQDQQKSAERVHSSTQSLYSRGAPGQRRNPITQHTDGIYHSKMVEDTVVFQDPYKPQKQPQSHHGASQPKNYNPPFSSQEPSSFSQKRDGPPSTLTYSQTQSTGNWNDTPESFFRPPASRRGTPGANIGSSASSQTNPALIQRPTSGFQPKPASPLAPPPKNSVGPPSRLNSPTNLVSQSIQPPLRSASTIAGVYSPPQPISSMEPQSQKAPLPRGPSPYQNLPSSRPPNNRYAPTPSSTPAAGPGQSGSAMPTGPNRQGPLLPNPYAPQENFISQQKHGPAQYGAIPSIPPVAGQSLIHPESHKAPPEAPPQGIRPGVAQAQQPDPVSSPNRRHR